MSALAFVRKALPWLGTVASIAGVPGAAPVVAIASKLLSTHLGTPVTPETFEKVLTGAFGDPAQQAAALEADREFQKTMQAMGYQHEADMEAIAEKDRESARLMQAQTKSWVPPVLAIAVTIGFFGLLALMVFRPIPPSSEKILDIMTGTLGTAFVAMFMFYFGSSAGSERKTELLAQS
jgi:cation transport ATPase